MSPLLDRPPSVGVYWLFVNVVLSVCQSICVMPLALFFDSGVALWYGTPNCGSGCNVPALRASFLCTHFKSLVDVRTVFVSKKGYVVL